jgi:hypothetical protein
MWEFASKLDDDELTTVLFDVRSGLERSDFNGDGAYSNADFLMLWRQVSTFRGALYIVFRNGLIHPGQ